MMTRVICFHFKSNIQVFLAIAQHIHVTYSFISGNRPNFKVPNLIFCFGLHHLISVSHVMSIARRLTLTFVLLMLSCYCLCCLSFAQFKHHLQVDLSQFVINNSATVDAICLPNWHWLTIPRNHLTDRQTVQFDDWYKVDVFHMSVSVGTDTRCVSMQSLPYLCYIIVNDYRTLLPCPAEYPRPVPQNIHVLYKLPRFKSIRAVFSFDWIFVGIFQFPVMLDEILIC